ncbi:TetR/AcrR family transcriptional regulator [Bosea beijingensis]
MYVRRMTKRRYSLGQRAASQEETRRRIVEATMQLHEDIGPRATTISAIAEKAGVQRLTVYRHFPDETELFKACTSHWLALNPLPDPSRWAALEGLARVHSALHHLYAYYRTTEPMWTVVHRDEADVPALQQPLAKVHAYLSEIRQDLFCHISHRSEMSDRILMTLGSAVCFSTWRSLSLFEARDDIIARTVCDWLRGILRPGSSEYVSSTFSNNK